MGALVLHPHLQDAAEQALLSGDMSCCALFLHCTQSKSQCIGMLYRMHAYGQQLSTRIVPPDAQPIAQDSTVSPQPSTSRTTAGCVAATASTISATHNLLLQAPEPATITCHAPFEAHHSLHACSQTTQCTQPNAPNPVLLAKPYLDTNVASAGDHSLMCIVRRVLHCLSACAPPYPHLLALPVQPHTHTFWQTRCSQSLGLSQASP